MGILFVLICVLTACGNTDSQQATVDIGKYHYKGTQGYEELLIFLNGIDAEKYEVVDINYISAGRHEIIYKDVE